MNKDKDCGGRIHGKPVLDRNLIKIMTIKYVTNMNADIRKDSSVAPSDSRLTLYVTIVEK